MKLTRAAGIAVCLGLLAIPMSAGAARGPVRGAWGRCVLLAQLDAQAGEAARAQTKAQTTCPVMGAKIDKSLYVDHDGKRIYVCCPGCIAAVKENPQKYVEELEAQGITLERTPVGLCRKRGEIKGSKQCCKLEGRTKCQKCGLLKGSPGCCNLLRKQEASERCGERRPDK